MKKILTTLFLIIGLTVIFVVAGAAQTVTVAKKEADRPVKIIRKPVAQFGNCPQSSGVTLLRVTFDKSAKITEAVITKSSGCESFDKSAVRAALGIKFKPAIKGGEEVTVSKPVEYAFRVF